jgi:hypothetical protein
MAGVSMKIYGVSTTRNGTITNANYNTISPNGFENGRYYHLWYPVEIPEGTNSLFTAVTKADVDSISVPYSAVNGGTQSSLLQERMILIHNDSNAIIPNVRLFIADQQLTGCVAEVVPWDYGPKKLSYVDFEVLTSSNPAVNFSPTYAYIKASIQDPNEVINSTSNQYVEIQDMPARGWAVAALRIYGVKDQAVEEDYCILATESN